MKAIILAAGMGTRLGKYTENLPKGMLPFNGKTLIEWQLETMRCNGIESIAIVTGYMSDKVDYSDVDYFHNDKFQITNMVESLMCARDYLNDDVIVSYGDVIYQDSVLSGLIKNCCDIVVSVDMDWKDYWAKRYGHVEYDLESMRLENDLISSLGAPDPALDEIDARYVGLIKFTKKGIKNLIRTYENAKNNYVDGEWRNSRDFNNAYMTDMIQELIDTGNRVCAEKIQRGWLEFDTVDDYEIYQKMIQEDKLNNFIEI